MGEREREDSERERVDSDTVTDLERGRVPRKHRRAGRLQGLRAFMFEISAFESGRKGEDAYRW